MIIHTAANNVVTLIPGETDSGKTTQVPWWLDGIVIVTQPNRISAVSLAARVASLQNEEVGVVNRRHPKILGCFT